MSHVDDESREGGTRWLSADEVPRALICAWDRSLFSPLAINSHNVVELERRAGHSRTATIYNVDFRRLDGTGFSESLSEQQLRGYTNGGDRETDLCGDETLINWLPDASTYSCRKARSFGKEAPLPERVSLFPLSLNLTLLSNTSCLLTNIDHRQVNTVAED